MIKNVCYINQSEVEALKQNWKVWAGLSDRGKAVFKFVKKENCNYVEAMSGGIESAWVGSWGGGNCYRIKPDYTLPAPTEAEIIEYLKDAEWQKTITPAAWSFEVMEWAMRKRKKEYWMYWLDNQWTCSRNTDPGFNGNIHYCLRPDFGKPVWEDLPVIVYGQNYCIDYGGCCRNLMWPISNIRFIGFVDRDGSVTKQLIDASQVVAVRMRKE